MTLRGKLREIIAIIGPTPVAIRVDDEPAKKLQVAIAQITDGSIKTVTCNGVVYAWRELSKSNV